jgi:hypothetical protein
MPDRVQIALDLHRQALFADAAGAVHRQYQRDIHLGARGAFHRIGRHRLPGPASS